MGGALGGSSSRAATSATVSGPEIVAAIAGVIARLTGVIALAMDSARRVTVLTGVVGRSLPAGSPQTGNLGPGQTRQCHTSGHGDRHRPMRGNFHWPDSTSKYLKEKLKGVTIY
jgi:hypothetical protein